MFSMGLSMSLSHEQQMLCTVCDESMATHSADKCPQAGLEALVNGTIHYRCPICFETRLTINEDDFWQCYAEDCRKVFTQGGLFGFKLVEEEGKPKEYFVLTEADALFVREIPVEPKPSKNARAIKMLLEQKEAILKEKGLS